LDTFGTLTNREIFFSNIIVRLPRIVREFLGDNISSKKLRHAQNTAKLSTKVARELIQQKAGALLQGKGSRDIMSLLVKANASENENARLSEDEMFGLMRVVILAGHETTANTLSWMLLELSRHPEMQAKLREEIRSVEDAFHARGDSHYTSADLDSMPYLNAVMKVNKPNKGVFGEDADMFDPERWLDSRVKKTTSVGVIGNLACIGWKFAVVELQAFIFELLGNFEFFPTNESQEIRREAALVMVPTLKGEVEKGAQLRLGIRAVSKEEAWDLDVYCPHSQLIMAVAAFSKRYLKLRAHQPSPDYDDIPYVFATVPPNDPGSYQYYCLSYREQFSPSSTSIPCAPDYNSVKFTECIAKYEGQGYNYTAGPMEWPGYVNKYFALPGAERGLRDGGHFSFAWGGDSGNT
ncbi:hypothetical protein DXG01_008211, partial [Tephrocybe rancida]